MEIWKDVVGYEGLYQVSDKGQVRSFDRMVNATCGCKRLFKGRVLKPHQHGKRGKLYCQVTLYKDHTKIKKSVHRLVAEAFIKNPNNYPCINHKDENPSNNEVDNLEWCTYKYNNSYGTRLKVIGQKHMKKVYCVETGEIFESIKKAAEVFNFPRSKIGECCNGRSRQYKGFTFRFIDMKDATEGCNKDL